ncbi:MAG: hypothetical protein IPP49_20190 [Saprospiraceae bacterium]|nr:hypothetical protein [Saprospiraceae bacterium]
MIDLLHAGDRYVSIPLTIELNVYWSVDGMLRLFFLLLWLATNARLFISPMSDVYEISITILSLPSCGIVNGVRKLHHFSGNL